MDVLEEFDSTSYIEEFMSGGPQNYAFTVFCPSTGIRTTKCKVKSLTLNYENSKVAKLTALRSVILEDDTTLHVQKPKKIKRKNGGVVVSNSKQRSKSLYLRSAGLRTT